ncbi:MAG: hypothetical protein CVV27_00895, partial [Candidatus Melainabacteria bacterium HGW-Melainabacteria-1]
PAALPFKGWVLPPVLALLLVSGILFGLGNALYQGQLRQLQQNLPQKQAAQLQQNRYERPVLRGKTTPGNGADAYWQIIGKSNDAQGDLQMHLARNFSALAAELDKGRADYLDNGLLKPKAGEQYLPLIQALQSAAAYAYIEHDYGFTIDAHLPNFIIAQDLAKMMISRAMSQCQPGPTANCRAGAELFLDVLRLG